MGVGFFETGHKLCDRLFSWLPRVEGDVTNVPETARKILSDESGDVIDKIEIGVVKHVPLTNEGAAQPVPVIPQDIDPMAIDFPVQFEAPVLPETQESSAVTFGANQRRRLEEEISHHEALSVALV